MTRYLLPAEWHPQQAIQITWPHAQSDWDWILEEVEACYLQISKAITTYQDLIVTCYDQSLLEHVEQCFRRHDIDHRRYKLFICQSNDTWARDYGPITVFNGQKPQLLDFTFNGWGNKFESSLDNLATSNLTKQDAYGGVSMESIPFVLEGGSIESDGAGTLITTTECLLSPERNPEFTKAQIDLYLKHKFGLKRILWLNHGALDGDDTDGHIDTLARFCSVDTIAFVTGDDSGDQQDRSLKAMAQELSAFRQLNGSPYRLIPLPSPRPIYDNDGHRLPATYANFLIINGAVIAPVYDDPADDKAIEQLKVAFPDRKIVAVNANALIKQYGSIHCITMQIPSFDGSNLKE